MFARAGLSFYTANEKSSEKLEMTDESDGKVHKLESKLAALEVKHHKNKRSKQKKKNCARSTPRPLGIPSEPDSACCW